MAGSYAWDNCGNNELVNGNVVTDGAARTGLYSIISPIPASLNTQCLTKAQLALYTNIPTGNIPISSMSNTQCISKENILSTF